MSIVYDHSKRVAETQNNIRSVLAHSMNGFHKLEAGPATTLEHVLNVVKPDIFIPIKIEDIKPKMCSQDPQVWWVVTTIPVCFGWKNGFCKNVSITYNGVHNYCKFRHDQTPYIRVETVPTDILLNKMKNRVKKLRENGTRNKKPFFVNPFTGVVYPCNYKQVNVINNRKDIVVNQKNKVIRDINDKSIHSFEKNTYFTTKWVIGLRGKLGFVKEFGEIADCVFKKDEKKDEKKMNFMELDNYLRTSPSSIGGKSWADISEDEDDLIEALKEAEVDINDGWTTVRKYK